MLTRNKDNPIIKIEDVKPSREDLKVIGVFNCGAAVYKGETLLLCRVAETAGDSSKRYMRVPVIKDECGKDTMKILSFDREDPDLDFSDTRTIYRKQGNGGYKVRALTSLSHLRLARSEDGVHFSVGEKPAIMPTARFDSWGMEDPRITQIGNEYYINCTSVTSHGAMVSLFNTSDFVSYNRMGVIFAPSNKDVTIFPEKINGKYVAFNRPDPGAFGNPDMWISCSDDLIHWGEQKLFSTTDENSWSNGRIGAGAVPIRTDRGWLEIYHGADTEDRYCLGACLLDINDPSKIIANLNHPLMEPETEYENGGFLGKVIFTCGATVFDNIIRIYYGAADDKICRADIGVDELLRELLSGR